jgi:hypothetical protein
MAAWAILLETYLKRVTKIYLKKATYRNLVRSLRIKQRGLLKVERAHVNIQVFTCLASIGG